MSTQRAHWAELARALQVVRGQVRRTALNRLIERALTDAVDDEKQGRRRERRGRREAD